MEDDLPPGFVLDTPETEQSDLPPGFVLDTPVDYEKANAAIAAAVERGGSRADVETVARQNGIDPSTLKNIDEAIAFRKKNGRYGGYVNTGLKVSNPETIAPHEDKGILNAGILGALDVASAGGIDELAAGIGAAGNSVAGLFAGGTGEDFSSYYSRVRDENRQGIAEAQTDHPYAFGGGQVAASLATLPIGAGGLSLGGIAARGAISGAAYGAGSSNGDLGDRVSGAATGAILGAGSSAALGVLGRMASPTVSGAVRRLLDAGVPLSVGQSLGNGAIGAVARESEQLSRSLPFIGKQVTKALDRSSDGYARALADASFAKVQPSSAIRKQFFDELRPEQIVDETRKTVAQIADGSTTNAGIAAGIRAGDELEALANATTNGKINSLALANDPDLSIGFRSLAEDGAEVFGGAASNSYIEKLLGGALSAPLMRGVTGIAGVATLGPTSIPKALVGAALLSKQGQAIARSAVTGRQGAVARGVRSGIENYAPLANPVIQSSINPYQAPLVPNIDQR